MSNTPVAAPARPIPPITKRDGSSRPFDAERIVSAVARAGAATGEFGSDVARGIA